MKPLLNARHLALALAAAAATLPPAAFAHGLVGKRFFPATIATDDPFVSDELSLPTISSTRTNASGDEPGSRETSMSGEFSKRITPNLGVSIGVERQRSAPAGQAAVHGWGNTELGVKYQIYQNEQREALASVGMAWEVGGTGSRAIGAERFSTFTPAVFFGKGFGDVASPMLKPLAVTGSLGVAIPRRSSTTTTDTDPDTGAIVTNVDPNPHVLQLGFALEYSLPYLQSFVKDVGLSEPFSRMIPLVEVSLQRPLDRVTAKRTTGTINPGVLWVGRVVQVGVEAVIPINRQSGHGVGMQAQLHFFLDDIFPNSIGRPLIASAR
ncbi:MAG: uncharacterized protein JWP43_3607 [Ramlibacter sp.]|nr:uncharacterized protein [Ramlibacter sp.]